jgi:flagellar biogenesis protein FliO
VRKITGSLEVGKKTSIRLMKVQERHLLISSHSLSFVCKGKDKTIPL